MESRRVAVRVTKDAERQIKGGHPWVYDSSIQSVKPSGHVGDLAVIFDADREFVAIGLYDPSSAIPIRILHRGRPTPIDDAWFADQLGAAIERRAELARSTHTTGYRVVHGENDGLPGLVLDRYADTYVLKLYTAAWLPHLDSIVAAIAEQLAPTSLVLRWSRAVRSGEMEGHDEGSALIGVVPAGPVLFVEGGLTFAADVVEGQKTGWFLDQRDNRNRVRSRAAGCRVLDVYSCSGGFSVNAAAGGAVSVLSVDISPQAIAAAKANMARNADRPHVAACRHDVMVGDAVATMSRLVAQKATFDLVVVDPPSFASRREHVERALHSYRRLTELALQLLEPGGTLVQASCSAQVTADQFFAAIAEGSARVGIKLRDITHTGHGIDHPVGFPQGAYLKALYGRRTGS